MASLQDQLLKAGLVDKNKANKVKKEKQKKANANRRGGGEAGDQIKQAAQLEQSKKVERDRELNKQKQAEANRKAVQAQIRQLVQINRIDREGGELAYSFVDRGKVKNLYIDEHLQKQLSLGRLAIVSITTKGKLGYELVPTGIAEKIAERDSSYVVQILKSEEAETEDDDPYAAYQIPDDLMW
ncbi:MAG: DUF2058 domain-containing protein [Gammaproteobacteria bacterium]|nr:DUF2058 domain-containing protein [Gammaproteobacteria bacterium]